MSDGHDDSGKTGAFFLGMLVGMLLAGGAAGTFFVTQIRFQAMRAEEARMEAEDARAEAESARREADLAERKIKHQLEDAHIVAEAARREAEAAARKAKE